MEKEELRKKLDSIVTKANLPSKKEEFKPATDEKIATRNLEYLKERKELIV